MKCLVGIDDTDSSSGLCTTYLAFRLASLSRVNGFRIIGYPRLVRLNPNIPFKTRGNAAVSLLLEAEDTETVFKSICRLTTELSDLRNGANTGVVFLTDFSFLPMFSRIYQAALNGLVNKEKVKKQLRERGVLTYELGNGMGIVGASASVGFDESYDHTYELIAYRNRESWGRERVIDHASVLRMDQLTFPHTFNNYDYEKRKPLIAPHGPDPVFLGIRGDSPDMVLNAFRMIQYAERIEGSMVYVSNQCTDAHLCGTLELPLKAFSAGNIKGTVHSVNVDTGGHVYITISVGKHPVRAAVYEPTGSLRRVARSLLPGDRVVISGGVRKPSVKHDKVVNVEGIQILSLVHVTKTSNPVCEHCNSRMKSEGHGKGFQCERCGSKAPQAARNTATIERKLLEGSYLPSPRANRHLTKPLIRYGINTAGHIYPLVEGWLEVSAPTPLLGLAPNP